MEREVKDAQEMERLTKFMDFAISEYGKTKDYSVQRFDYIIIGVSTASIFLLTNLIDANNLSSCSCTIWFQISITLFVLAVISNLIGQFIAFNMSLAIKQLFLDSKSKLEFQKKVDLDFINTEVDVIYSDSIYSNGTNTICLILVILALALSAVAYWAVV